MRAILQLDISYCGRLAARALAPLNNEYIKPRSSENAMRGINGAWKRAGGGEKLVPELNPQLIIFPKEMEHFQHASGLSPPLLNPPLIFGPRYFIDPLNTTQ